MDKRVNDLEELNKKLVEQLANSNKKIAKLEESINKVNEKIPNLMEDFENVKIELYNLKMGKSLLHKSTEKDIDLNLLTDLIDKTPTNKEEKKEKTRADAIELE